MKKLLTLLTVLILATLQSFALSYSWKSKGAAAPTSNKAMACSPATELVLLQYNNVRALIETGGNMWQDRSTSRAFYRIPAEGLVSAIYAGSLWLGGISPDQQLKLAAVTFRTDGNDFWPGPLTTDGAAEVDADVCEQYDQFFLTERQWSERHFAYHECLNDPFCDVEANFAGYIPPPEFETYPAHGNVGLGQDYYLAPFFDYNNDGNYEPSDGDYPWYDINNSVDCANKSREDTIPLFGDQNFWWIFNDKGNVHTESNGEPIGMEIRAQAFAFATNDEINNMTFYNYVLINRGTTSLNDTYFGQWVDADLGTAIDDFVGCDVQRGLGYAYNGDDNDESSNSSPGYGNNPPAIGVDFFEGPYQDYDQIDNAGPDSLETFITFEDAVSTDGIPYSGLGIGYGDGVPDNERFGMRKFLYYNNTTGQNGDPSTAQQYYNYLIGIWRNGIPMTYGGDGFQTGNDASQLADFMFPGDTDIVGFGTDGNVREPWDELTANNDPADRRFIQSAGPFSLAPGDYNNITVGVVYGRSLSGNSFQSVEVLRQADDKAQALFDNCFEIIAGPDAPDVTCQELDQEVILYLSNENSNSTNFRETYSLEDPSIPPVNSQGEALTLDERSYKFQGYQIYQLRDNEVTINELDDLDQARLIKTIDIEDDIVNLVNYTLDREINEVIPSLEAQGENEGIIHSISITDDAFATESSTLVNYKTYYFIVLAYGYNNYEEYNTETNTGQDEVYKASRKAATGGVQIKKTIPHPITSENNGSVISAQYGDGIELTRIEGIGNFTNIIDLTPETEEAILNSATSRVDEATYVGGASPVNVKVIDPLALQNADFELQTYYKSEEDDQLIDAFWRLTNLTTGIVDSSDVSLEVLNESLLLDYGISVTWKQYVDPKDALYFTEPLSSTFEFDDPSEPWLIGFPDGDGFSEFNWIRSGTSVVEDPDNAGPNEIPYDDYEGIDIDEEFEGVLGGIAAPYVLTSYAAADEAQPGTLINTAPTIEEFHGVEEWTQPLPGFTDSRLGERRNLQDLNNVDIVFTSDKSKWTRCPVLEMQFNENLAQVHPAISEYRTSGTKNFTRAHPSVDKNGLYVGQSGYNAADGDFNGQQPEGMGWFPGYAIDQDTGERLNMAFGEDSWLGTENGRDMIWNPSSTFVSNEGEVYAGGQHWIYVFKNKRNTDNLPGSEHDEIGMPGYDSGQYLYERLAQDAGLNATVQTPDQEEAQDNAELVYNACTWVMSAILTPTFELNPIEDGLIPNDARVRLRVAKDYRKFSPTGQDTGNEGTFGASRNNWDPLYTFSTDNVQARSEQLDVLEDALADINVVPNPYYAFSTYEENKLDNRIKIINLPFECEVSIYDLSGTLIRQFSKADPVTFLDWDLKNEVNIPIASGIYIIHVKTDAGERILKWFGVMRPVDLDNF
ncbi:MAG: T9SS type A sorting domain-containing protein [Flavobacteriales bacterium]